MKKGLYFLQIILLSACSVTVKTYQKPNQTFDDYRTWCWLNGCDITYQGPDYLFDQKVVDEIANAIAFNMHEKGYQQGDDQADLIMNFFIVIEEDSAEVGGFYNNTYRGEPEWLGTLYPEYQKFLKGSLIIDAIDREKSELIWRSNAVRYADLNPVYDKDRIWTDVKKAMRNLPSSE